MTPRERILATLNHRCPDRIPTDGWFHPEVMAMLKRHFATSEWSEVLTMLGIEGWAGCGPGLTFPDFAARARPRPGTTDGRLGIWLDERTYEDAWGVRQRLGEGDRYEEWLAGPLQAAETVADLDAYDWPDCSRLRAPENYRERVADLQARGLFVTGGIENPFKRIWHLRGYQNALMDYLINPELVEAIYDRLFAIGTESCRLMAEAGVDMINVVGDIAMQDRIIMGPDAWRRVDKPRWSRLVAATRRLAPDIHFFFHSDGKLTDLVDDLIEIGFDVINPIQPECMDPFACKARWGDRITLHGCISIQETLPFGTVDDVRREVSELIAGCGRDGGLVLMPSNVIQPDTPVENIIACYETAKQAVSSF